MLLLLVIFGPGKAISMARDLGRLVSGAQNIVEEFKSELASSEEVWNFPGSTDTFPLHRATLSHSTLLEIRRTPVAQSRVQPVAVVEALQVLEDRRLGRLPTEKPGPAHQLCL